MSMAREMDLAEYEDMAARTTRMITYAGKFPLPPMFPHSECSLHDCLTFGIAESDVRFMNFSLNRATCVCPGRHELCGLCTVSSSFEAGCCSVARESSQAQSSGAKVENVPRAGARYVCQSIPRAIRHHGPSGSFTRIHDTHIDMAAGGRARCPGWSGPHCLDLCTNINNLKNSRGYVCDFMFPTPQACFMQQFSTSCTCSATRR